MKWMRSEAIKFAILLMVAVGAGPAGAALWQWSTTPATNSTADPTINWSAGIPPSTITPNGRSTMAAIAAWRNDLAAVTTLGGSGSGYTLVSNQGGFTPTADRNGFTIGFVVNATNAVGVAINVDGGGAKPLRTISGATIASGVILTGQIHHATYRFATDEWLLHAVFASSGDVPIGTVLDFSASGGIPGNYVLAQGGCINRVVYATYFALVGSSYGVCDGATTFGVPDLRGRVVAGNDTGLGRLPPCADFNFCGVATTVVSTSQLPSHQHNYSGTTSTDGDHNHSVPGLGFSYNTASNTNSFVAAGGTQGNIWGAGTNVLGGTTSGGTTGNAGAHGHTYSGSTSATGGGSTFSLVQPTFTMNKIIRIL